MYKGIGQYFPFHVEMNPFQRDKTAFTLGYTVRILGKHLLFPLHAHQKKGKRKKHSVPSMKVYLKERSTVWKSKITPIQKGSVSYPGSVNLFWGPKSATVVDSKEGRRWTPLGQASNTQRTIWNQVRGPSLSSEAILWTVLMTSGSPQHHQVKRRKTWDTRQKKTFSNQAERK